MKSIVPGLTILVCCLTTLSLPAQDVLELKSFSNLPTTEKLKVTGPVKSLEQFTCSNGASPVNKKDCRYREYYEFDSFHRMIVKVDPIGDSTVYTYAPREVKQIHYSKDKTVGATRWYTLTTKGLKETETIENGQGTKKIVYTYDSLDNLLTVVEYSGRGKVSGSLNITYDSQGNPITINTSHGGGLTTNTFVDKRLVKSTNTQFSQTFTYTFAYDKKGNLAEQKQYDSNDKIVDQINYRYDQYGNITERVQKYATSTGSEGGFKLTNTYTYDKHDNWTKMTSQSEFTSDTYRVITYYPK